jgi:hypothetical protein
MKRWIGLLMAACLWASPHQARAGEVSESITNKNIGGPPLYYWGGTHWERWDTASGPNVNLGNPDRETLLGPLTKVYYDTLSALTRPVDSLLVPIDVHDLKALTVALKLEGAGVSGVYRIAVQVRWHPGLVADSSSTWTQAALFTSGGSTHFGGALVDSVAQVTRYAGSTVIGTTSGLAWPHETSLIWDLADGATQGWYGRWIPLSYEVPPGVRGMTFKLRVIATPLSGTVANPFRFRVDVVGRAL